MLAAAADGGLSKKRSLSLILWSRNDDSLVGGNEADCNFTSSVGKFFPTQSLALQPDVDYQMPGHMLQRTQKCSHLIRSNTASVGSRAHTECTTRSGPTGASQTSVLQRSHST